MAQTPTDESLIVPKYTPKQRQEFEDYLKRFQLREGQELTKVNQIYAVALEKLWVCQIPNADKLVDAIKKGNLLDESIFTTLKIIDPHPTLRKIVQQVDQEYKDYCKERKEGFTEILTEYANYNTSGTGRLGPLRRWWNDRSYDGAYADDGSYSEFIGLIDQIALIDSTGLVVNQLLKQLSDCADFAYNEQSQFLDVLYASLMRLQASYFTQRANADEKKLECLKKYFNIAEKDKEKLKAYYDFVVYQKKPYQSFVDPTPPACGTGKFPDQLIFDIHQVRDYYQEEENHFKKEVKLLKKSIHHVAQELGLPSQLRKTSSLFAEFAEKQKVAIQEYLKRRNDNFFKKIEYAYRKKNNLNKLIIKDIVTQYEQFFTETDLIEKWLNAITSDVHAIQEFSSKNKTLADDLNNILQNNLDLIWARITTYQGEEEKCVSLSEKIAKTQQELTGLYYVEADYKKFKFLIDEEQQKNRAIEHQNYHIGNKSSKITSIGEGCVAASSISLAIVLGSPLVILLSVLFAGYYINNLLFKGDNKNVLDAIRLKKKVMVNGKEEYHRLIFLDSDGNPISNAQRYFIWGLGSLSVATGIVYGALSFMSSFNTLPNLFSQISSIFGGYFYAHLPTIFSVLQIAGSALPAVGMTIGITCIFFTVIADFIRQKRWVSIGNYFEVNFLLKNGNQESAFWTMDNKQKAWHVAKCMGRVLLLGIGIGVTVAVTYFSAGVFYKDSLAFLNMMAYVNPWHYVAKTVTWINGFISTPFQVQGANDVLQPKAGFTFSNVARVSARSTESEEMSKPSGQRGEVDGLSAIQKDAQKVATGQKVLSLGAATVNGIGYAWVTAPVGNPVLHTTMVVAGAAYSGLPNEKAALKEADSRLRTPRLFSPKPETLESENEAGVRKWRAMSPL